MAGEFGINNGQAYRRQLGPFGPASTLLPEDRQPLIVEDDTPAHDAVDDIRETSPIVKLKDEQAHGEYRTKRVILEIDDEMAWAIETGKPYQTCLAPPPGPPTDAEGNYIPAAEWDTTHWPSHIHPPRAKDDPNG